MFAMNPIPFEQFMENALHDPVHGYYARRIKAVGPRGDFTTAPMLSEGPARAIAAWAAMALRETRCRDLIEIGPGEGTLAASVLKHLPWHLRWKTRLHLIETSLPLAERQQKLLGKRATWHRSPQAALQSCQGNAVIYSNELVDAFPVRRYQKTTAGWQELAVHFDERKQPHESLLPPAPLPDSSGFLDSHPLGQHIEVHDSYRRYLADWLPHWKSGRMLTIDYGATAAEIYHRRPHGTLRGYLFQQRLEGQAIYQNIGRQDLTADVNFTDLQNWSQPWICEQSLTNFSGFLSRFKAQESTDPHGVGTAFLVLDQKRSADPIATRIPSI
jgi:SAM-dependent MidA family methyltransferase